ncbi:MAG: 5-deoxy-glucuronate isomerase [Ruminococcaceae bacterium]|nr:5-deoxy-glucuronate isomerase [Oscillospiraceae bacterium]
MNYKKSYNGGTGYTPICKIGECSLKKLEFGIIELEAGGSITFDTLDKETAFIMLEGHCDVCVDDTKWENIGNRSNVFENRKAESFYMPRDQKLEIKALDHIKIAVCATPVTEKTEPQLLREDHVVLKLLGKVPYERETSFIIDGNTNAKVLTIGEAYVTEGNWAGFPPHKHDVNNMPHECIAEEIYYFLFDPKQGFAVQCLYTADGEIDEAYKVKNDELVEFPKGYHTTVATPGYQSYFLWLMAGDYQGFNRSNDPEHDWVANK